MEVRRLPHDDPRAVEALAGGPGAVFVAEERGERLGVARVRPREDVAELRLEGSRDGRAAEPLPRLRASRAGGSRRPSRRAAGP